MLRTTLCQVRKGRRLLLKMATRGVSRDKWNGLGGKIDRGESEEECAIREVWEESGLRVRKMERCGVIDFYKGSRNTFFIRMHLFLIEEFEGRPKGTEEGELRWFDVDELPYSRMWDDDIYWLPFFLKGFRFDAEFVYDKDMKKVIEYSIKNLRKGKRVLTENWS